MSRRIAGFTTVMLALLSPVLAWAQPFDPQNSAPAGGLVYGAPAYGPGADFAAPRTRYTQMPDDNGWAFNDSPLEAWLKETFRHAFFRLEYLNWSIDNPGETVLGELIPNPNTTPGNFNNVANQPFLDPFEPFVIDSDFFTTLTVLEGQQPTLNDVNLRANNGIRGSWGFNFEPFSVEASVFALQTARSTVLDVDLPVSTIENVFGLPANKERYVAQGVLINGSPDFAGDLTDHILIYDTSYYAVMRTEVWGAEARIVRAPIDQGGPLQIRPLLGIKYVNFNERLRQVGTSHETPFDTTTDVITRRIESATQNYLYGPELGGRIELVSKWLTLGVEPTIMLGVNSYRASLATEQILRNDETPFEVVEKDTTFGPVADLQAYANGRLTDNLSVYVAYNFMWAGFITRPADNIIYNINGGNVTDGNAAFVQNVSFSDVILQGISVGGEVKW